MQRLRVTSRSLGTNVLNSPASIPKKALKSENRGATCLKLQTKQSGPFAISNGAFLGIKFEFFGMLAVRELLELSSRLSSGQAKKLSKAVCVYLYPLDFAALRSTKDK